MRTRVQRRPETPLASVGIARESSHLADRELVRVLVEADGSDPAPQKAHLLRCTRCASRVRNLQAHLDHMAKTAEAAFDEAVPAWRLLRQRRRIMRRIQHATGPQRSARILRFPTASRPVAGAPHETRRWLSRGAAAGVLIAAVIGHVAIDHHQPATNPRPAATIAPSRQTMGLPAGAPQSVPDEQFMRELEEALTSSRIAPLTALDELTPRVRDLALDIP